MILDTLDNLEKYASLNPLFPKAIEFVKNTDLAALPLGRNEIMGDEIFANVMEVQPRTKEEVPVEVHRKYVDIQIPISGDEVMGYTPLCDLPQGEYSDANDVTLYPAFEKKIVTSSVANIFTLSGTHKAMGEEELDGYLAISLDGRWTPSTGIKAHRLYFKIEENDNSPFATTRAKSIRIVVAGEGTTGVEDVKTENAEVETIYDLSGRRVLEAEKGGIYIVNGVKPLVK
jgi:YhcH/YjgK/YiaL family protein